MKKLLTSFTLLFLFVLFACQNKKTEQKNTASDSELPEKQWVRIFNGRDLQGWQGFSKTAIPGQWIVEDGVIKCNSNPAFKSEGQHSIVTMEQYGDFELSFDFKIMKNGNSGVMYHVSQDTAYQFDYETGPEYQILDDDEDPDRPATRRLASNYDLYAAVADKRFNGVNEWNLGKILYSRGKVEHWLNGIKVLEFVEGSDEWLARVKDSKWNDMKDYAQYKIGHISLQDHGNEVWYRNIRIRSPY